MVDLTFKSASQARNKRDKLLEEGYKVRVYPFYEKNIRKFMLIAWKEKK